MVLEVHIRISYVGTRDGIGHYIAVDERTGKTICTGDTMQEVCEVLETEYYCDKE